MYKPQGPFPSYEGKGRTQRRLCGAVHEVRKQNLGDGVSLLLLSLHEELNQFAGADHLGLLPSIREVTLVASDEVIRLASLGAFEENVVAGISAFFDPNAWLDPMAKFSN